MCVECFVYYVECFTIYMYLVKVLFLMNIHACFHQSAYKFFIAVKTGLIGTNVKITTYVMKTPTNVTLDVNKFANYTNFKQNLPLM